MKYIVAGNIAEYKQHIYKMGYDPQDFRYVSKPQMLYGLGEIEGFYIGSYMLRDDIDEIRQIIGHIKSKRSGKPVIVSPPRFIPLHQMT